MKQGKSVDADGGDLNHMSFTEEFKSRADLIKAYCDTAKSYIQISAAALALPIVFTQAMFGKEAAEKGFRATGVPLSLVLAWISFLLTIGFGLLYQWLAIRLMWDDLCTTQITWENKAKPGYRTTSWVPQFGWLNRSFLYGGMVLFFYLGAILFVWFAAHSLQR
jgi:hypothetical protein